MKSKLKELLNNNKGSTLVTVIIAISLVGILASLILVIVQNSYVTKSIDSQSKNNFYSAEEVVDQLKLGIQNEIAASMVDAYYDVISSFQYSEDSTVRERRFREYVLKGHGASYGGFISKIKPDSDDGRVRPVDIEKLNGLISKYYKDSLADKYRLDVPKNATAYIAYEYDTTDYRSITIRNIGVEYYNSTGYVNGLFTDIKIDIPTPDFSLYDPNPNKEFEKFAIMARENVELVQANNTANVNGSVWIGNDMRVSNSNSSIDINAENVYVKGEINVGPDTNGTTSRYAVNIKKNTNDKATLCAGNISLDSSSSTSTSKSYVLSLNADTYVNNDLVFEGDNSVANITGTYHGIGSSDTDPDYSSAIIVNGRNNELDASRLDQITLGGSSFIKTYQNNNYKVPNSDKSILTGDSIAPRSNELSYLVPSEFMKGLPNPVTRADLAAAGYGGDFAQLTRDVNDVLNSSDIKPMLAGYYDSVTGQTSYVRVLHYTYSSDSNQSAANNMSVAYYYLNFTSATAAKNFYKDEVNDGTKRMLLGLIPVKLNVKTNDDFRIVGVGLTKLTADNNGVSGDPEYSFDRGSGDMSFNGAFSALMDKIRSFLTPDVPPKLQDLDNSLPDNQKFSKKDAIDNIINWSLIDSDSGSGYILHENQLGGALLTVKRNGTTYPLKARIYKGASVTLNSSDLGGTYYGLIISTGDIIIQGNVDIHGLVIAGNVNANKKGNVYIRTDSSGNSNAKITADPGAIRDIFNRAGLVSTTGGTLLSRILNGYVKTNNAGKDNTELSTISMDNMFTYENWARN